MLDEISRAIREKRYVRFQPAPEEIDSIVETSLNERKQKAKSILEKHFGIQDERGATKTLTNKHGNKNEVSGLKQVGKFVARTQQDLIKKGKNERKLEGR